MTNLADAPSTTTLVLTAIAVACFSQVWVNLLRMADGQHEHQADAELELHHLEDRRSS